VAKKASKKSAKRVGLDVGTSGKPLRLRAMNGLVCVMLCELDSFPKRDGRRHSP
jgi:hypothetical protein